MKKAHFLSIKLRFGTHQYLVFSFVSLFLNFIRSILIVLQFFESLFLRYTIYLFDILYCFLTLKTTKSSVEIFLENMMKRVGTFDFQLFRQLKNSKVTFFEHNLGHDLVRHMLCSTFCYQINDLVLHCRTKSKELSNKLL
jgi:hypothetical protein